MQTQKGDDFMENKELIDKAIGFIQHNPKENLSLRDIAENAGFSCTYFDAIFKQHTGYSPVEYSRVYKLTRSALELRRTDKTILETALDFGYSGPESFSRAFKAFYGIAPNAYRKKYSGEPIDWHSLSGRIAIEHFRNTFPELKPSDIDSALDFCFTHNPIKYAEDIVGMTVAESRILTLGDPAALRHFIYVSDYNSVEPSIDLVSESEDDALPYLALLSRLPGLRFLMRKSVSEDWIRFDDEAAKHGLTCRRSFVMVYAADSVELPVCPGLSARLLTDADMPLIRAFKERGACAECHVRAIESSLSGRANVGMKPCGIFSGDELVCLGMPTLDRVRELKKYDIGAIFAIDTPRRDEAIDLMWKYVIDVCLKDGAVIGNAAAEEDDSPLGVSLCEAVGLTRVAERCCYRK